MRLGLIVAPLLLCSSPLFAQAAPNAAPAPAPVDLRGMQQVLADPAMTDKMFGMMETLTKALLDMPIGNVEAVAEGRKPTAADRRRTVRSETGMSERELRARMAAAKPMLQQSMQAIGAALPSMMQGLAQAQQSLERAAANMPDPNYPKR